VFYILSYVLIYCVGHIRETCGYFNSEWRMLNLSSTEGYYHMIHSMLASRMFHVVTSTVLSNCLQTNLKEFACLWHEDMDIRVTKADENTLQYTRMVKGLPQF